MTVVESLDQEQMKWMCFLFVEKYLEKVLEDKYMLQFVKDCSTIASLVGVLQKEGGRLLQKRNF